MKAIQLIDDALIKAGVLEADESADADQGRSALRELNRMAAGWEQRGILTGYSQLSTTDAEVTIPVSAEEGVIYSLALRLAGEYGTQISPVVAGVAQVAVHRLLRDSVSISASDTSHLPGSNGVGVDELFD